MRGELRLLPLGGVEDRNSRKKLALAVVALLDLLAAAYASVEARETRVAQADLRYGQWSAWMPTNLAGIEYRYEMDGAYVGSFQLRKSRGGADIKVNYGVSCPDGQYIGSHNGGYVTLSDKYTTSIQYRPCLQTNPPINLHLLQEDSGNASIADVVQSTDPSSTVRSKISGGQIVEDRETAA